MIWRWAEYEENTGCYLSSLKPKESSRPVMCSKFLSRLSEVFWWPSTKNKLSSSLYTHPHLALTSKFSNAYSFNTLLFKKLWPFTHRLHSPFSRSSNCPISFLKKASTANITCNLQIYASVTCDITDKWHFSCKNIMWLPSCCLLAETGFFWIWTCCSISRSKYSLFRLNANTSLSGIETTWKSKYSN